MSRTYSEFWKDYELIDVGNEKKLERWGDIITIRPDRNAYFKPVLSEKEWKIQAHFEFIEKTKNSGEWITYKEGTPTEWQIGFQNVNAHLKLTKFKHIGIFPEQQTNWEFIGENLKQDDRFLNLFGYTGVASLVACSKGADVFHCDSIKQIINWGNENMASSGLADIHWVLEDAMKFAAREVKRGNKYKGIIMDPPAYGIGANKERWKIEDKFHDLVSLASELVDSSGFVIVNTYSPKLDIREIESVCSRVFLNRNVEVSKLALKSTTGKILEYGELTRIV